MQPPDNIVLLRQGVSSFTELGERIIDTALKQGWIEQDEYQKTRINQEVWGSDFSNVQPLKATPLLKTQH